MQLDLFEDGRDVMLRNDVLQALQQHDASRAQAAWTTLQRDYTDDVHLAALRRLLDAEQTRDKPDAPQVFYDHAALRVTRLVLLESLEPTALGQMGPVQGKLWLQPLWQELIVRAAHLPFRSDCELDHAAPMRLHIQDWQGALDAVVKIESWRRIPAPLSWMAQAKLRLFGLRASWPLLAELAWLAPRRLAALIADAPEPTLQCLKGQFDADFETDPESGTVHSLDKPAQPAHELAWLPAWVLTARPQYAADLALAEPGQHSAPEQALRLLVHLLGLEHQGRHHDLVKLRKNLRDLHAGLFAAYIKTR